MEEKVRKKLVARFRRWGYWGMGETQTEKKKTHDAERRPVRQIQYRNAHRSVLRRSLLKRCIWIPASFSLRTGISEGDNFL